MVDLVNIITCVATTGATIVAAIALIKSNNTQRRIEQHQRKEAAIRNFQIVQEQVLDHLELINKYEVVDVIRNLDRQEFKEIYEDYKVVIARCEHFAVGVAKEVYDFDTVDALAGKHLIDLYDKLLPVIRAVRKENGKESYFTYFEQMVNRLREKHSL